MVDSVDAIETILSQESNKQAAGTACSGSIPAGGLSHVHLMHANDSRAPLGSRIDRHAGIGEGHIGREGFRRLLRHPQLRRVPFILETPVKDEGDDRRNLEMLKALAARARTSARQL
jgi:hypothetical protein